MFNRKLFGRGSASILLSAALALATAFELGACGEVTSGTDSSTHWLKACAEDADCGSLACLCGACTKACSSDSSCQGLAQGICTSDSACASGEVSLCQSECSVDQDCNAIRSGLQCVAGSCREPATPGGDGSGGTGSSNGGVGGSGLSGGAGVGFPGSAGSSMDPGTAGLQPPPPLADCSDLYTTTGILARDCASAGCHAALGRATSSELLLTPDDGLVQRLKDVRAKFQDIYCGTEPCTETPATCPPAGTALLVDSSNWENSWMIQKLRMTTGSCGDPMPISNSGPYDAAREACLERMVQAIAALP